MYKNIERLTLCFFISMFTVSCDVGSSGDSDLKNKDEIQKQVIEAQNKIEIEEAERKKREIAQAEQQREETTKLINSKLNKLTAFAEEQLKSRLSDPDSILIKNKIYSKNIELVNLNGGAKDKNTPPLWAVTFSYCFDYNTKNRMGGYVGYEQIRISIYYLKDDFIVNDVKSLMDYDIDGLHFAAQDIRRLTGIKPKPECIAEKYEDSYTDVVKKVYNSFYNDKNKT